MRHDKARRRHRWISVVAVALGVSLLTPAAAQATTPGQGRFCVYAELGDVVTTKKGTFRCQVIGRRGFVPVTAWVKIK